MSNDKNQNGGFLSGLKTQAAGCCHFLYNPEKGTVMDRSAFSWGQIVVFYLVFYSCLVGFFAVQLALFFTTIDSNEPKLQYKQSILKGYPGMGYKPQPDITTTLIRFEQGQPESYSKYTTQIQTFAADYEYDQQSGDNYQDCSGYSENPNPDKVCRFLLRDPSKDTQMFQSCVKDKDYGYDEGQPCVLLKLNKIFDWMPELYTNGSITSEANETLGDRYHPDYIGVSCQGENPADVENLGPIEYEPPSGFHKKYYPYRNQEGYRQPIVFAKFKKPKNGVLIQVWCKAWAENIYHHKLDKAGSVRFELLID
jgi:sodium/potassium-transporting ATPase subunit beta